MRHLMMIAPSFFVMQLCAGEQLQPVIHVHTPLTINNYTSSQAATAVQQQTFVSTENTNVQTLLSDAGKSVQEYSSDLFSWVVQNKFKAACYGALLGYGYLWYKLLSLHYALLHNTNWSTWHETLTLEELLAKPQQEVATDLLTCIQRQYINTEQFDDIIGPLIAFVRDVDIEINQLKQLSSVHTWIDRLKISFLFPKQTTLRETAQDKINRLTYLKNLLLNWVSEHKVARLAS